MQIERSLQTEVCKRRGLSCDGGAGLGRGATSRPWAEVCLRCRWRVAVEVRWWELWGYPAGAGVDDVHTGLNNVYDDGRSSALEAVSGAVSGDANVKAIGNACGRLI